MKLEALFTISLLWVCITPVLLTPLPSRCILFMLNKNNSEDYRPSYEKANVIEMELSGIV
jgi:hypothetical protein